jgi:glyoxylase I family protein
MHASQEIVGTHIGLTVSDLQRSIDFYVELLGFKIAEPRRSVAGAEVDRVQGLQGVRLELAYIFNGALAVELMQYVHPLGQTRVRAINDPGCHHLSFAVPDVLGLFESMHARGVPSLGPPRPSPRSGRYTVLMRDPDGNLIELIQGGGFTAPRDQ